MESTELQTLSFGHELAQHKFSHHFSYNIETFQSEV